MKRFANLLLLTSALYALLCFLHNPKEPNQVLAFQSPPDCTFTVSFSGTGTGSAGPFQNFGTVSAGTPCVTWRMTWDPPATVTGLSIELDGAPQNAAGTGPGTFAAMTVDVIQGNNPSTAIGTNATMALSQYAPWIQVSVTTFTGSGTFVARVYGYRANTLAGAGGATGPTGSAGPTGPTGPTGPSTFSAITGSTNNGGNAMVVGSTSSIGVSGSGSNTANGLATTTIAGLSTMFPSPSTGNEAYVTNGATNTDCTVGGGAFKVDCIYNGSAFVANVLTTVPFSLVTGATNNGGNALIIGSTSSLNSSGTGLITANGVRTTTVGGLATMFPSPVAGNQAYVTDGTSATDCTTGGSSTKVLCIYNGVAFVAEGGGSSGPTGATGATGATGPTGSNGSAGATGATGATGTAGTGSSAASNVTPVTVSANVTTDQTLQEVALSAGFLNTLGQPFLIHGSGIFTIATLQTPSLTWKVKLCTVSGCGSGTVVTLATIATASSVAASNNPWNINLKAATSTTGASGALYVHGSLAIDIGAVSSVADSVYNDVNTTASSAINLTAALYVDFTVATSTGNAGNIFQQQIATVEPGSTIGPTGAAGPTGPTGAAGGGIIAPASITTLSGTCSTTGLQLFTDALYSGAYCNGSTWQYFLAGQAITPPGTLSATYAWTAQNSSTVTQQTNGAWTFLYPGNGSAAQNVSVYDTATPSVPFTQIYRLTAAMSAGINSPAYGVDLRESATGKYIMFSIYSYSGSGANCVTTGTSTGNAPCILAATWSSITTPVAVVGNVSQGLVGGAGTTPFCLKVSIAAGAAGAITLSYSVDNGLSFVQLYSAAKNTFFTTAPDHIGIFGDTTDLSATYSGQITLLGIN